MRTEALNESSILVRDIPIAPWKFAEAARRLGVSDAVASYETVGLFDVPADFDLEQILQIAEASDFASRTVRILAIYDGPDLDSAAELLNLTPEALALAHQGTSYPCHAVGFRPGFAYLGPLSAAISGLPRRAQPRTHVPPGSIAVTGRQTAIYPIASPGGWQLIGRTPHDLSVTEDLQLAIRPGDIVQFVACSEDEFQSNLGTRPRVITGEGQ
ncbi:DUR1 Allophanate hydrolase subunit 1 [Fimbriimonadaceae bacterium]